MKVGAELEFHVFRADDRVMSISAVGQPGAPGVPPLTTPTTPGAQLLHEEALDGLDELVQALYRGLSLLDLPVRSIEIEFGHSQLELTMEVEEAAAAADSVVICRTAIRQIASRLGYKATFMSRPIGSESASTGWHLHQSLWHIDSNRPVFAPEGQEQVLSSTGSLYLAGLLENASAAAAFTTPTVNGYKRYRPWSLAPDRIAWGVDNRGAMIRVVEGIGGDAPRLENRSGEPAANPYLYILSQLVSGLDGVDRRLELPPATENPYDDSVPLLPEDLGTAIRNLESSAVFRKALGDAVVDWFTHIKQAEYRRYLSDVSSWEHREYFSLF